MIKKIKNKDFSEIIYKKTLNNGLEVYLLNKEDFADKSVYITIPFGGKNSFDTLASVEDEIKLVPGVAHFLEHRAFVYKKESLLDILRKYSMNVNAMTSIDKTVYYFSGIDNFYKSLKQLLKFVFNFEINQNQVEEEKKIITQELMMYKDDHEHFAMEKAYQNTYYNIAAIKEIGGLISDIEKIDANMLKKAHSAYYNCSKAKISIVGDFKNKHKEVFDFIENNFPNKEKNIVVNENQKKEPFKVKKEKEIIYRNVEKEIVCIVFKFKKDIENNSLMQLKQNYIVEFIGEFLFGEYSKGKEILEEKELDNNLSYGPIFEGEMFSFLITASCQDGEIFNSEIEKIIKDGQKYLTKENFEKIKKDFLSYFIRGFDSIGLLSQHLNQNIDKNITNLDSIKIFKEITYNDVLNTFNKYFKNYKKSYTIVKKRK